MYKYVIAGFVFALSLAQGPAAAQAGRPSHWGIPRDPIYKCIFYNDFEQAICSGLCATKDLSWIADWLPYKDENGDTVPGEGHCDGEN